MKNPKWMTEWRCLRLKRWGKDDRAEMGDVSYPEIDFRSLLHIAP